MDFVFWKGIFIGLVIAFPTGPVGFLTLRRSYLFGMKSTMYSATGAVITDAFYGIVVGFGLQKIARFLGMVAPYTQVIAGIVLVIIGVRSYFHRLDLAHHEGENTPIRDIGSIAILNALNPTLVFSFTVLFTGIGMGQYVGHPREIIDFLMGIAVGTFAFWFTIGKAISYLRRTDREHWVQGANKYTGVGLAIIGAILLIIATGKVAL